MQFGAKRNVKPAVVYISYDGMLEPLGQSQVLAYHKRLTALAMSFDIMIGTFVGDGEAVAGVVISGSSMRLRAT